MGVKDKGLMEKILYRYTYIGTVEREGKVYKKYEKVSRFKNPKRLVRTVFVILLLIVVSSLVIFLMQVGNQSIFDRQ